MGGLLDMGGCASSCLPWMHAQAMSVQDPTSTSTNKLTADDRRVAVKLVAYALVVAVLNGTMLALIAKLPT